VALKELVELSRFYGKRKEFVIAGGGNTSFKDEAHLFIKASGTSLAEITEEGMVKMRRDRLDAIWSRRYDRDPARREAQALADLMDARVEGETKRPSVETLLHELLRHAYVVHTHPALVNGLTCARRGEKIAAELFPERMIWIPVVNPGYILARTVKQAIEQRLTRGDYPNILFLQNHGVFVAADSPEEIRAIYGRIMANLESRLTARPDLTARPPDDPGLVGELSAAIARELAAASGAAGSGGAKSAGGAKGAGGDAADKVAFVSNRETARLVASRRSFAPLRSLAYTPDHIVYCGHEPAWVGRPRRSGGKGSNPLAASFAEEMARAVAAYRKRNGHPPRVIAVEGIGLFVWGESPAKLEAASAMLLDAVGVAVYSESFGGPRRMPDDKRDFIRGWEVEQYRAKINAEGAR